MSRKHYEAIAAAFKVHVDMLRAFPERNQYANGADDMAHTLINTLASVLESDNERFDRKRFLKACGI